MPVLDLVEEACLHLNVDNLVSWIGLKMGEGFVANITCFVTLIGGDGNG